MRTPGRKFIGQRPPNPTRGPGLDLVADLLLTGPAAPATGRRALAPDPPATPAAAPQGPYVLVPAGVEPEARRRIGLAVARRLAPACRPAALFVFEKDRADAHLLGEPACGRAGPQNYLHSSDPSHAVGELIGQCEQVGILLVDFSNGALARLGGAVRQVVFVAAADPESLVETYREVKAWRTKGPTASASLFIVGSEDGAEAAGLHRRLSAAARQFLGCEVGHQGFMGGASLGLPQPLSLLEQAPAEDVWPRLLAALPGDRGGPREPSPLALEARVRAAVPIPREPPAPPDLPRGEPTPAEYPVFSWWTPEDRRELLAAVEAQVPALMGERLRLVFSVDVDEPDAPPLAAVRDDGALVAILLKDAGGAADTQAARRWLEVHRSLLARAYPAAGVSAHTPAAIVLAPFTPQPAGDGIRRFLPVRTGGRHGIVLLP